MELLTKSSPITNSYSSTFLVGQRDRVTVILPSDPEASKVQGLKTTYLQCLNEVGAGAETLRQTIVELLQLEIPWQELVKWAKDSGHNTRSVQKLLSQILLCKCKSKSKSLRWFTR